ncbi:MAG: hypothetical protein COT74_02995 [Bdellovibrionales bacterium CG10_big_fil_rev_8_21_14_0_10_45_34]|nr:MAG: hypothetical protein COT74_02995 [Bdellovibrionales bacterium CG10_big_fil_rev_8_21_14_0_10_45_34]
MSDSPSTNTQVVILAGGLGTRLRPITEKIPKPLVEVAGRPYLEWQLLDLKKQGFRRILLLVSHLGEMIKATFGDGSSLGMKIDYCFEETPLGTGGAIKNALKQLDPHFLLLNGDSFLPLDFKKFATFAETGGFEACLCAYDNRTPTNVPENLNVTGGTVSAYAKGAGRQGGMNHVDAGAYYLSKTIFEKIRKSEFQLEDLWPELIAKKHLGAYIVNERFYDIGTLERLQDFSRFLSDPTLE